METAEEGETRSISLAIYICDVSLHSYIKTLLYRLARRREYDRCRRAAMTPEQHQQQREWRQALNEQSGRNDQTGNDALSRRRRENYRLRREMETDEERQSRLTANSIKIL